MLATLCNQIDAFYCDRCCQWLRERLGYAGWKYITPPLTYDYANVSEESVSVFYI